MKVAFLLPHGALYPIGGFKMVFEYANRLAHNGWDVTIVYPSTMKKIQWIDIARYVVRLFTKGYKPKWFQLDTRINQKWVLTLERFCYDRDSIVVGTFITTVLVLNKYNLPARQKVNFIQGFEMSDEISEQAVYGTYHFSMKKIVISHWLKDILDSLNEPSYLVPNGFDSTFFHRVIPIERRDCNQIIYMYHVSTNKGVDIAFRAFDIVKERHNGLRVTLFSAYPKPDNLPEWYEYYVSPDRETFVRIYNEASIYIGSSRSEGWGLTVGEAMMCGCAVACTDNKGYLEMTQHGSNALVSPVGDAEALAENIIRLIQDKQLRCRIANAGYNFIQSLSIEKSVKKFEKALME